MIETFKITCLVAFVASCGTFCSLYTLTLNSCSHEPPPADHSGMMAAQLEPWDKLFNDYNRRRRPNLNVDDTTLDTAYLKFKESIKQGYHYRTVQEHAIVLWWEVWMATTLYAHRQIEE